MSGSFTVTNAPSLTLRNFPDGRNNKLAAELGQIITATVTNKTDAVVSLATADGFKFDAAANRVSGEVGDELKFEVVRAGKNGLELRQLKETEQSQVRELDSRRALSGVKAMLKQSGMYRETDGSESAEERDLQLKAMEAASKIKRKLRYISNNASRSAMKELLASGVSLDKISIDILNSVMREIESKPDSQTSSDELDAIIDKYMKESGIPAGEKKDKALLAKSLEAQGLPPTAQNMRAVGTVLMKIRELGNLDDDSIAKLLKEEKALTIENIYLSQHTSAKLPDEDKLPEDKWRMLEREIDRIFEREGIVKTDKSLAAAQLLIEREVPITAENVDKVIFLRELESNIDTQKLIYQAAGRIKQDRPLADVNIYADSLPAKYESIMADLPFITARHLEHLLKQESDPANLTVGDCCRATRYKQQKVAATPENVQIKENLASVRDQILEIRRKLTYEAATSLIAKKIDITEMKLDQAISNLDALAAEADYSKNLRAMNAEATAANNEMMHELYTRLNDIKPTTNHVFAALLAKTVPFTVRAIHETVSADRLRAGYEQYETVITPKHGDSFAKVRSKVERLLEANGVIPTNENIKAAGILIKNRMDVTPENITEIRLLDEKIFAIQNKLHPNIAAAMIKEKMNPLDMHIDEILDFVDGFKNKYGEGIRDKLAEHIRALDDTKTLTQEERDAMIAVYRALNAISKDESIGLGLGLKYGGGMTLGDLLSDAQNFRRYRASDAGNDFENGMRPTESNIRQMLENIPRKSLAECELNSMIIDKISEKATPKALRNVLNNGADKLTLLGALEFMGDEAEYSAEEAISRMQAGLDAADKLTTEQISRMEYARAPVTVANMQAMQLLENVGLGRTLDRLAGRLDDEEEDEDNDLRDLGIPDGDLTALKEGGTVENLLEDISARLDDIKDNVTSRSLLDELILVQNALLVQRHLSRNEPVTLPVRLSGGIAGLNMYVLDEAAARGDNADLVVVLDTPNLGKVSVLAKRSGSEVKLEITSENPRAGAALTRSAESLRGYLAEAGYKAEEITFKENHATAESGGDESGNRAETRDPSSEFEARV